MADEYSKLPPLAGGGAAVITGGASGIGLAAARRFAGFGMPVVIADLPGERLEAAQAELSRLGPIAVVGLDVANPADFDRLRDVALSRFGHVAVLMNNAGAGARGIGTWNDVDGFRRTMEVNFFGVLHGVHAFLPAMIEAAKPAFVVNTGSKQGITTPPGNPPYNVSKAALKAYTEALQHELRNLPDGQISAHLLIPGFTFTGITAAAPGQKQPPSAWSADQVVDFMLASLARGDFYILCPDNETTREMDDRRIRWAAEDLIENRPALSRWHPDYAEAFAAFMKGAPGSSR